MRLNMFKGIKDYPLNLEKLYIVISFYCYTRYGSSKKPSRSFIEKIVESFDKGKVLNK